MVIKWLFLLSLFIFHNVHCQDTDEHLKVGTYRQRYLFLFGSIVLVAIIRHTVRAYDIPIPYNVFCITLGILWGLGSKYDFTNGWMTEVASITLNALHRFDKVYLPVITFSIAFCVDPHTFTKSLPQIVVISVPVALISVLISGFTMKMILGSSRFEYADAVLFGTTFLAIYPMDIMYCLKETSMQTKHVTVLLEGETLITAVSAVTLFGILCKYVTGWVIYWYQFILNLVREFVLGVPVSFIIGHLGAGLMKFTYNDTIGLFLVTVSMCYVAYFYVDWIANAGVVGTTIAGMIMGLERTSLTQEMEKTITSLWTVIVCVLNGVIFLTAGLTLPNVLNEEGIYFKDYVLVLVTYLVVNLSRFVSFFIFSPILSRVGYGMPFQNMIFCVWAGLKNPICLSMAEYLYNYIYRDSTLKGSIFYMHTTIVFTLMLFINGSLVRLVLKALGLSKISISRKINMNNCIKSIEEARTRTIAILKMDRFLSDANWPLVMSATALKHPYEKEKHINEEEEESDYFFQYKYTYCPDCQRNVPNEPTAKELKEMTREAKLRLLKLKKTAYSRMFENGMMSSNGLRIMHQAVEMAMDSESLVIELDGLFKLFAKEGIFYRFLMIAFQYIQKTKQYKPPRKLWRLWCYRIVNRKLFFFFMTAMVTCHFCAMVYYCIDDEHFRDEVYLYIYDYTSPLLYVTIFCFTLYLFECILKIYALSWIYIFEHGVKHYFGYYRHLLEFSILCLTFIYLTSHIFVAISQSYLEYLIHMKIILTIFLGIRSLQCLRIFGFFKVGRAFVPTVNKYLESKIDRHRALAFELGKNYIAGEEEILENLHQIIDNDKIREEIKERIESDRLAITKRLGTAQKESPIVATTVKTKLGARTVLQSMKEDVHELKTSGWMDDLECGKLLKCLNERYKFISSMKSIQPVSFKLLFKEIPFMGDNEEIIEFLYANVTTKKFAAGEAVYKEGDAAEDVYILITGMLMSTYTPNQKLIDKLRETGTLPLVDYVCSMTYEEPMWEYIVPGNTVGDWCVLTGRPYDGILTAETHSQVFVINRSILNKAFEMDMDPVKGLKCRMWKYMSFKQALTVMMNTPSYRSYTQQQMKYILERAFVPDLSNYKIFVVNNMMADIILIEGLVVDFNSRDIYTGPCYIPRAVQKLIFPTSSYIEVKIPVETKLLIIPAKDYDEYDIMVTEEEICELVNVDSNLCLRHLIQDKKVKASSSANQFKLLTSGLKKKGKSSDTFRSKTSTLGGRGSSRKFGSIHFDLV